MSPRKVPDSGKGPWRVILIQLGILVSLAAFYFLYLPFRERSKAEAEAKGREDKIEELVKSLVAEDSSREVEVPGADGVLRGHPQRLIRTPGVGEFQQLLGLPEMQSTDFRGGFHVTWVGTEHSLEASFDKGRLYCLRYEDLRSHHGALIFESSNGWHPF